MTRPAYWTIGLLLSGVMLAQYYAAFLSHGAAPKLFALVAAPVFFAIAVFVIRPQNPWRLWRLTCSLRIVLFGGGTFCLLLSGCSECLTAADCYRMKLVLVTLQAPFVGLWHAMTESAVLGILSLVRRKARVRGFRRMRKLRTTRRHMGAYR